MSVDFTGWKSGDRGVMEVEFEFFQHGKKTGHVFLESSVVGEPNSFWHNPSLIKSITRIEPPIKVGDRVRTKTNRSMSLAGIVSGFHEGSAAVEWDDGFKGWTLVSLLERIA